jgi:FO synthase
MNESITRAAGATHGQEMSQTDMLALAVSLARSPVQRTTLYRQLTGGEDRDRAALAATASSVLC